MAKKQSKRSKRWMQTAVKRPGALRRKLGKKKGEKISMAELEARIARLRNIAKKRKLTPSEARTLKQLVLARTFKRARRARK